MNDRNEEDGIGALIARAIADGRDYASAEVTYWRTLAADRAANARSVAVFGIGALLLVNAAVIGLILGCIMTLAPHVGPGLATLIVVLVAVLAAGLLGWSAAKHVRRLTRPRGEP